MPFSNNPIKLFLGVIKLEYLKSLKYWRKQILVDHFQQKLFETGKSPMTYLAVDSLITSILYTEAFKNVIQNTSFMNVWFFKIIIEPHHFPFPPLKFCFKWFLEASRSGELKILTSFVTVKMSNPRASLWNTVTALWGRFCLEMGTPYVHQAGFKLRFPSLSLLNAGIISYPGLVWFCVALIILELDMQTRVTSNS